MNLFVESLANYIKNEWDQALTTSNGTYEVRFIVESLDPHSVFELFSALDERRLQYLQNHKIECHFRVAYGLWQDWLRTYNHQPIKIPPNPHFSKEGTQWLPQIDQWIDREDRLTWYRNRTCPSGTDGLAIVLVGLNHASDQGGLADFHQVDEQRIWQIMGNNYYPWIRRLNDRLALEANEIQIARLNNLIIQLFQTCPRRLAKLAEFLETEVISDGHLSSMGEVIERFFTKLPFWGLPPLLTNTATSTQKTLDLIKEAGAFISHQKLKTPAEQKKAWDKIQKEFDDYNMEIPQCVSAKPLYTNLKQFRETLHSFIFSADTPARERLLQTDLGPVLNILKRKPKDPKPTSTKIQRLSGLSLDVLLQAIWKSLVEFKAKSNGQPLFDRLQQINITFKRFNHDLEADDKNDAGSEPLAREWLKGCLGGITDWIQQMDCRLPMDHDQIQKPQDQWERVIPITLDLESITFGTSRSRQPHLQFEIRIETQDGVNELKRLFHWNFGPTQPERVRYAYSKTVLERWQQQYQTGLILPAFQLPTVVMSALYFAADHDEAHRLISQALNELRLINLLAGELPNSNADPELRQSLRQLIHSYHRWLECSVKEGYYQAIDPSHYLPLSRSYFDLAKKVLDPERIGSNELLRRFYKAFLLIDEKAQPNDGYLASAMVWGISLPVIELTQTRTHFLCNHFPKIVAKLALNQNGEAAFNQLLNLTEIHRPLAGLVIDAQHTLSAAIKSFGLLHYIGVEPSAEKSLAVQTLLRDEESDDDEDIADLVRISEESLMVERVLKEYQSLYPFAQDGLRILAVHIKELATILSGVNRFLNNYLKTAAHDWPPFHCELTVYSTSSSPLAMESSLAAWRDVMTESYREKGRALILTISHRFAPTRDQIIQLIQHERRLYDIAFLFHFLSSELTGETEPALPFEFDFNTSNINPFPICEYPRPIQHGDAFRRESLLSNRRLRLQTCHADLSARLRHPQTPSHDENLIFGQINYKPWQPVVEQLHHKAQWVACIDPFVDKRLIGRHDPHSPRKIVGFTSGLGAYGELNLSISTEQDTLTQLTALVKNHLIGLMPFQPSDGFEDMAVKIVSEAEEIMGLSSLRAVVGEGEKIREVVGFAAIRRALAAPPAIMSQLLPIDTLLHWFANNETLQRPDLLQLSLILRENDLPLIQAVVIECKFAQYNPEHLLKATDQVQQGLSHLTQLFMPNQLDVRPASFDQRYWWAQLQRALTSRSVVTVSEQHRRQLDQALEHLTEGYYEIAWEAAIFTFWTDIAGAKPTLTAMPLPPGVIESSLRVPDQFAIWHIALGYEGVTALFTGDPPPEALTLPGPVIRIQMPVNAVRESSVTTTDSPSPPPPMPPLPAFKTEAPSLPPFETEASSLPPFEKGGLGGIFQKDKPSGISQLNATPFIARNRGDFAPATWNEIPPDPPLSKGGTEPLPVPEQIFIGTRSNGEPVYWHYGHPQLLNRHLLIFGAAGSGKTYGIQCLLAEMAKQQLHSIIVDYTDGFLPKQIEPYFREVVKPKNHFLITEKLPLNPFRRQKQIIDPSIPPIEEKSFDVASRIASIFTSVFETMGDQQSSALIRVLEAGIEEDPQFSLDDLLALLRDDSAYGESLANKLEPLIRSQPFQTGTNSAWEAMLNSPDHRVHVLQLKGLAREIQRLVTEFVLWDLYDYVCNSGNKYRPVPVVLDEIQNLDHRSDSPIDKMLREGRKFGLSMILATQTTSQFDQEQRDRLFQASHKLFFKPATTEIERFSQLLSQATGVAKSEWSERLAKLEKGQCWSLGSVKTSSGSLQEKAVLTSITALEKRTLDH